MYALLKKQFLLPYIGFQKLMTYVAHLTFPLKWKDGTSRNKLSFVLTSSTSDKKSKSFVFMKQMCFYWRFSTPDHVICSEKETKVDNSRMLFWFALNSLNLTVGKNRLTFSPEEKYWELKILMNHFLYRCPCCWKMPEITKLKNIWTYDTSIKIVDGNV